jgi:hypothetical protein
MSDAIAVGQKRQIYNSKLNQRYCVEITQDNIGSIIRYDSQDKTDDDWKFGDVCAQDMQNLGENGSDSYNNATISFQEINGRLVPTLSQTNEYDGGRRSRKVKKSKTSKKRPTARRRRSSKARQSRKARKARKARSTRRR